LGNGELGHFIGLEELISASNTIPETIIGNLKQFVSSSTKNQQQMENKYKLADNKLESLKDE